MNHWARAIFLALVVLLASSALQAAAQNRPSDLIRNLPGLASTSLDRFHLDVHGRGLEGPLSGPTQVIVDGLPVAHTFLGDVPWNALPFATAAVDSLFHDPAWFLAAGHAASDGTIRIRSRREAGRHLRFSLSALNETGDPGPARFQKADDRNVDRSGPAMELVASSTREALHMEAGYRFDEHHMTDPALSNRVWSSYNGTDRPRVRIHAPWIRMDAAPGAWTVSTLAHARLQRDFRFIPEFGREWPTEEEDFSGILEVSRIITRAPPGHSSARRANRPAAQWTVGARGWGRDLAVASRPLRIDAPTDIRVQQGGGNAWLRRCDDRRCWRLEAGLRATETTSGGVRILDTSPAARLEVTSSDVDAAVHLSMRHPSLQLRAPLSAAGQLTLRFIQAPSAAASLRLYAERADVDTGLSLLSLTRAGAPFGDFLPDEPYVGITSDPGFSTRRQRVEITADVTLRRLSGAAGRLVRDMQFSATFRDTKGLTATRRVDQQRERPRFFNRESHVSTGLVGRGVAASALITGTRYATLWYRYSRMISRGNVLWWQITSGLAPHTLGLSARVDPIPRVRLSLFVAAESPRTFADRADSPLAERPWLVRSELSATKRLLGDAAAATLSLLNAPDTPLTLHPDAGNEQLAARIHVVLTL